MRGGFGPRFVVEAGFIVVVALVAGFAELPIPAIVLTMALAYLLVVVFELAISRVGAYPGEGWLRRRDAHPSAEDTPKPSPMVDPAMHVRVIPSEPESTAQPVIERRAEAAPEPEPDAPPVAEPSPPVEPALAAPMPEPDRPALEREPSADVDEEPEHEVEEEREPDLEEASVAERAPAPIAAVPTPTPTPEPEAEPEREPEADPDPEVEPVALPEPSSVVTLPVVQAPRQWNLWELERLVRDDAGRDALLDEERSYLLVYLREFATPEGTLPVDFDTLVRESFGELLETSR